MGVRVTQAGGNRELDEVCFEKSAPDAGAMPPPTALRVGGSSGLEAREPMDVPRFAADLKAGMRGVLSAWCVLPTAALRGPSSLLGEPNGPSRPLSGGGA